MPKETVAAHERHREFTISVEKIAPEWELMREVENEFKPSGWADEEGSIADFFFLGKNPVHENSFFVWYPTRGDQAASYCSCNEKGPFF